MPILVGMKYYNSHRITVKPTRIWRIYENISYIPNKKWMCNYGQFFKWLFYFCLRGNGSWHVFEMAPGSVQLQGFKFLMFPM